jgi:hypothetical protein
LTHEIRGQLANHDRSEKNTRARMGNKNNNKMMKTNNRDTASRQTPKGASSPTNCVPKKAPTRIELRRIRELEWATTTTTT